jgi:hypothetical protein
MKTRLADLVQATIHGRQGSRRPHGTAQPIGHTPNKRSKVELSGTNLLNTGFHSNWITSRKEGNLPDAFSHVSLQLRRPNNRRASIRFVFEGCVAQHDASQATGWECALQIALNGPLNGGASGAVSNDPSLRSIQPRQIVRDPA